MFSKMLEKPGQSQEIIAKMPKTILIEGGAGMGKTLIARALASEGLSLRLTPTLSGSDIVYAVGMAVARPFEIYFLFFSSRLISARLTQTKFVISEDKSDECSQSASSISIQTM